MNFKLVPLDERNSVRTDAPKTSVGDTLKSSFTHALNAITSVIESIAKVADTLATTASSGIEYLAEGVSDSLTGIGDMFELGSINLWPKRLKEHNLVFQEDYPKSAPLPGESNSEFVSPFTKEDYYRVLSDLDSSSKFNTEIKKKFLEYNLLIAHLVLRTRQTKLFLEDAFEYSKRIEAQYESYLNIYFKYEDRIQELEEAIDSDEEMIEQMEDGLVIYDQEEFDKAKARTVVANKELSTINKQLESFAKLPKLKFEMKEFPFASGIPCEHLSIVGGHDFINSPEEFIAKIDDFRDYFEEFVAKIEDDETEMQRLILASRRLKAEIHFLVPDGHKAEDDIPSRTVMYKYNEKIIEQMRSSGFFPQSKKLSSFVPDMSKIK